MADERPISVTERTKAEKLIKTRFDNLREAMKHDVQTKIVEMRAEWEHRSGLKKLRDKITAKKQELEELEDQLMEIEDAVEALQDSGYSVPYRIRDMVPTGPLKRGIEKLQAAERKANDKLNEQESKTLEKLWFGLLAKDALSLLNSVPSISDLKNNGLALLDMPVKKLLASK